MTDAGATQWTAPAVERVDPPDVAGERAALEGWLDYHRQTLLWKCAGLTADQLRQRAVPPSSLSLLGLVRHMADVERAWFRRRIAGEDIDRLWGAERDDDFDRVDTADPEADFATFAAEVEAARAVMSGRDLDETFTARWSDGAQFTLDLRWVMVHMIEEYARHNGHADLLREAVDGTVGD